ncbi:MAG: aspartate aminotransferase family protein [Cocleimonas sp.]|nr:aspartate aminotransferase family protein [Cocleimonas sp.]
MAHSLMTTYAPLPISFAKGEGVYLWDTTGKQYLDAVAGVAVCGLGHAHPVIAEAIAEQARTLVHTSNLYRIEHQEALSERLCALSGLDNVFFSNSGAEANEAAIKLARLYGKQRGIERPNIIVACGSFHGRTLATLSATGNRKVQAGFSPLVDGFVRVNFNDIAAIKTAADTNSDIVAILVEPVQGEGGVQIPDADYLQQLREICDANNYLLMLDEIQTGMGRTGEWFAFQHTNIKPDVMTLAKALGNGVPIGACLAGGKAASIFTPGTHGSTFGGNPLATRAALTVIDVLSQENIIDHVKTIGEYFLTALTQKLAHLSTVNVIRGKGLMIGIELDYECTHFVAAAAEQGVLINVTAGNTIRLLPPLIINQAQADEVINTVTDLIQQQTG